MAKEIKDDLGTIIVNGVDVSDCCYIQEGAECEAYQTECEAQVCYYQQLKRKEQEYKYWKHQAELGSDTVNIMAKEIENLKTENEELKKRLQAEIHFGYKYKEDFAEQFKECRKYEQALDEIEKFCSCYRENPVVGSAYDEISEIIKKAKGEE